MAKRPAVIFDIDGVLVDSYQAHFESWQRLAETHGFAMTEAQFVATFGCTSREIIAELWSNGRMTAEQIAALDDEKEAIYRDVVTERFPAMPGAVSLIDALSESGFALAVGSSGPRANVDLVVDRLERRESFGAMVSGQDVTRGKPDPQIFQVAAQRLGVQGKDCAVIEDAAPGIAAAKSAEMVSIALVSSGHTHEELRDADRIVDRLDQLSPDAIREWICEAS